MTRFACWGVAGVLAMSPAMIARAHETDQFSSPPGRDFADIGELFTPWVYAAISRAVERTNAVIDRRIKAGATAQSLTGPDSIDQITLAVFDEFPVAYEAIEGLEGKLHSLEMQRRYPGMVVAYKTPFGQIYQAAHFPLDPRRFFKFWFASTFHAYGVYSGTDKVGHFIDMGHMYYKAYRKAIRAGKGEMEARAIAARIGTDDPVFSEAGVLGYLSAGAYSNADLASNYLGMLFYINLTQPVKLKGVERPAMLERDGALWKTAPHVRRGSDFFSWFFSEHFDEALNPSLFEFTMRGGMKREIRKRGDNLLYRYRDVHGCRRSPVYFNELTKHLGTYWGEDYGRRGSDHELISLGQVCFERIDEKARPDKRNRTGHTALHWAVEMGDAAAVRRILDCGFPVDARMRPQSRFADSEQGNTALHLAARDGRQDLMQLLIARGADVNATNHWGVTPLHRARDSESAALLIARGAKVAALDSAGRSPLHWAAEDPSSGALPALLDAGADPALADHEGRTALHLAMRSGSLDAARRLLARGAPVNVADRLGITPLHEASVRGDHAAVEMLLAADADPNTADALGYTPLHLAARDGRPRVVSELLKHGAKPNVPDPYGTTPLHLAARHGSRSAAQRLLAAGADPQARGSGGFTPLHEAAWMGDRALVLRLLNAGAVASATDANGRTARQIAASRGHTATAEVFDGRSATVLAHPHEINHNPKIAPGAATAKEFIQ